MLSQEGANIGRLFLYGRIQNYEESCFWSFPIVAEGIHLLSVKIEARGNQGDPGCIIGYLIES